MIRYLIFMKNEVFKKKKLIDQEYKILTSTTQLIVTNICSSISNLIQPTIDHVVILIDKFHLDIPGTKEYKRTENDAVVSNNDSSWPTVDVAR